jgi:hypothetical protein
MDDKEDEESETGEGVNSLIRKLVPLFFPGPPLTRKQEEAAMRGLLAFAVLATMEEDEEDEEEDDSNK